MFGLFMFWAGRLELLELEACGDSEVGRWVGVVVPCEGEGEGALEELLRLEPTRFFKRAFMKLIRTGGERRWRRGEESTSAGWLLWESARKLRSAADGGQPHTKHSQQRPDETSGREGDLDKMGSRR